MSEDNVKESSTTQQNRDGFIEINSNFFDHILNCLANQKFVGEPPQNGDSLSVGKEEYYKGQIEIQKAIDDAYDDARNMQSNRFFTPRTKFLQHKNDDGKIMEIKGTHIYYGLTKED